ncbi:hypothetical protein ACKU27_05195 [Sphingobium yanoikuyae]|uniref:tail completion protein gp17 n=1 Tax=Sphingobium yanoikuyae TaxID=13690 RepID=UPI003B8F81B1
MASDLLRETERAAIISLKGNEPLLGIIAKASIEPTAEAPDWPFIRLEGTQSLPQGRGCTARAEVTFQIHTFAKPRYQGDPTTTPMVETARDYAGRINSAVVEAMQGHAYEIAGRRYRFIVRSSRLMQDGAERDAYHGIVNVLARAYQG